MKGGISAKGNKEESRAMKMPPGAEPHEPSPPNPHDSEPPTRAQTEAATTSNVFIAPTGY